VNDQNDIKSERLLKANDVSRILNISRALAYRLLRQGDIPTVRICHAVRVKPADLEEYIKRSRKALDQA
jgi:excisionase family DNA binding protein